MDLLMYTMYIMLYLCILLFIGALCREGDIERPPILPSILTLGLFLPVLGIAYGIAQLTIPNTLDRFIIAKEISWIVACILSGIISWIILAEDYEVLVPLIVFLNHILLPLPLATNPSIFVASLVRWVPRSILATLTSCLPLIRTRTLAIIIAEAAIISLLVHLSNYVNILNSWIVMLSAFAIIGLVFSIIDSTFRDEPSFATVGAILCGALLGLIIASAYESLMLGLLLDVVNFNAGLSIILNLPYVLTASLVSALGPHTYFKLANALSNIYFRYFKHPTPPKLDFYIYKCKKLIVEPNFVIVEVNERIHYMKVRRLDDDTFFEFRHPIWFYLLLSIEGERDLCKMFQLYKEIAEKLAIEPPQEDDIRRELRELLAEYHRLLNVKYRGRR